MVSFYETGSWLRSKPVREMLNVCSVVFKVVTSAEFVLVEQHLC